MTEQELGEKGLSEALDRLRAKGLMEETLIPLAEVLGWAYSLEELHRRRLSDARYFAHRDTSPEGQALAGLIYARGLVAHQIALVGVLISWPRMTRSSGGRRGGSVTIITGGGSEKIWKRFVDLPSPGRREVHGRDQMYIQHVEGRALLSPIETAVMFLIDDVGALS